MVKIEHVVRFATVFLSCLDSPRLEAEVLCAALLGVDRVYIKINSCRKFSVFQILKYFYWEFERRRRIPVAYITGFKQWGGFNVLVNEHVLIPRDETEILCEKIIDAPRNFIPHSILDVGTGSGVIALFCAKKFKNASIRAIDISGAALELAKKNAEFYNVNIDFFQSDLFSQVPSSTHFDIIIANLPYVPIKVDVSPEVLKEPKNAVFSGQDGLECIRVFARQIQKKNIHFQELWLEFLPSQKKEIECIFSSYRVEFYSDCRGDEFFAKITSFSEHTHLQRLKSRLL